MRNLHVVNARTGQAPEPAMLSLLCNGDVGTKLARAGLDIRPYFEARASVPVQFRFVEPEHGRFPATLYRPTRRERAAAWWASHRWPLLRGLVLALNLLVLYVSICLVMDGANGLADWVSAR